MPKTTKSSEPKCVMCQRTQDKAGPLVGHGRGPLICYQCSLDNIEFFNSHPAAKQQALEATSQATTMLVAGLLEPKKIKEYLDEYVIGQESAKKILSVATVNHYKGILARKHRFEIEIEKSNVLLIGPTGVGKTETVRRLAKTLQVPLAIGDATTLTEAGYVGEDVENLLLKLLIAADYSIEACERGIVYIDEIDKIGKKTGNVSITRDVSGEGVQQSLLKLIEGTIANVPPQGGRKHPEQEYIKIDTRNILFIGGGTFAGIEDIVRRRKNEHSRIGFHSQHGEEEEQATNDRLRSEIAPEDLIEYGMIPELVGRLPIAASLDSLSVEDLARVLTEPRNAIIKQFQALFEISKVNLDFTKEALWEIAKKSHERKTGARGLRSVVENLLLDTMYDLSQFSEKKLTITSEMVRGEEEILPIVAEAA